MARMDASWTHATPAAFGGKRIFRLGLAANYGIDEEGVRVAIDRGVNLFLWNWRNGGMENPLRGVLKERRDDVAVAAFASLGWFGCAVRRNAESTLKTLGVDRIDVLMLGWVGVTSALTDATLGELAHLKESGKVGAIGCSIHDRPRAGKLAADGALDLLMIRYNAAHPHPGAERDIFPHKREKSPSILAYTATSWRKLLARPKGWDGPVMTAGDCYRFQLSSPHVDVAVTGPSSRAQLEDNLAALEKGPLSPDEQKWMRDFGHKVHG
jgi:aryl-alcohol dehydrogenase-like predicted oxidoreductase